MKYSYYFVPYMTSDICYKQRVLKRKNLCYIIEARAPGAHRGTVDRTGFTTLPARPFFPRCLPSIYFLPIKDLPGTPT